MTEADVISAGDPVTPGLPTLVVLTDGEASARCGRSLSETVREAVAGGALAVLVREKDLPATQRRGLVEAIHEQMAGVGGRVGVASDVVLASQCGIDWVHLAQRDPRPSLDPTTTIGRSCHDQTEAWQAANDGCHYITMSPVALTSSKPGHGPALGPDGLSAVCHLHGAAPVWALGGVTAVNAATWLAAGARGIAVMGGIMGAADPAAATAELLDVLASRAGR